MGYEIRVIIMMHRKKIILATIIVGMALFVNLTMGNVDEGNLVPEQREYIKEPDDSFYQDYVVVKNEDGSLLLIPKENIDDVEVKPFKKPTTKSYTTPFVENEDSDNVNKFSSLEEFRSFLENHTAENYYYWPYAGDFGTGSSKVSEGSAVTALSSPDYSTTNVQVTGVDEGDIVKTDGEFAYIISKDRYSVFIIDVNPPEDAEILTTINTGALFGRYM